MCRTSTRFAVAVFALATYAGTALAAGMAVVYKDPFCGCCEGYIAHFKSHGIAALGRNTERLETVKRMKGVPEDL